MTAARILVVDVGGSHVKALASGRRVPIKVSSGPAMSAKDMVREVRKAGPEDTLTGTRRPDASALTWDPPTSTTRIRVAVMRG